MTRQMSTEAILGVDPLGTPAEQAPAAPDHGSNGTDRRRLEAALRIGDQSFRQLFDGSPDAMMLIDPHDPAAAWPIVDLNEAASRMNGYPRNELIGRSVDAVNLTRGTPPERAEYLDRLRREGTISLETFHRHKTGRVFPVEVSTTLVSFGDRELVLGIDRDITQRKLTEESLRRAVETERQSAERLREIDQMKNNFLTAVSHDLRTPLTSVLGSALTLERLRRSLSDDEQDELIRAISTNAQRLQRILGDLLDLDRLTRGTMDAVRVPTDLETLVRGVVAESGIGEDHQVHLAVEPIVAEVDGPKVERIVDNLLGNARRHTEPGTEIWVAVRPVPGGALLVVEDRGPGVPADQRERIFQPFIQVDPSAHSPGAGIGLALVAKLAELHGGRAWVEDRPGGGSSFRVLLPHPR